MYEMIEHGDKDDNIPFDASKLSECPNQELQLKYYQQ
jgi:hypothetical protein